MGDRSPPPRIRVLVVDDSVVVRRRMVQILGADPDLEIAGVAANGRIALAKIPQVAPDIVILDIDMPEMDGLATLEAIRRADPDMPVVMFSAHTERGADATLDALFRGATDYVTKPSNFDTQGRSADSVQQQLIPKIKAFCAGLSHPDGDAEPAASVALSASRRQRAGLRPVEAIAIAASTGGPNALQVILSGIPKDFPVPILVVQHMPPPFTRHLAQQLAAKVPLEVVEAWPGAEVLPGHVWIAPGGYHMVVTRDDDDDTVRIETNQDPPEHSCRPAADVLLRSVARTYGAHTLVVVLTGMGHDAMKGCEIVRASGGQVLAQDQASSVVWGMPGFVVSANLADAMLPLDQLSAEIVRRARARRIGGHPPGTAAPRPGREGRGGS